MSMPPLEEMDRYQDALYWPTTGTDQYGQPVHDFTAGAVVCLKVRWVNKRRLSSDAQGSPITIDASVVSNRELTVGSLMWLGKLADTPGTSETPESDLMIVVGYDHAMDIKGRKTRREALLQRYKNTADSQD